MWLGNRVVLEVVKTGGSGNLSKVTRQSVGESPSSAIELQEIRAVRVGRSVHRPFQHLLTHLWQRSIE